MTGQTIINLGTAGADLNGRSGSTSSADTNDPVWLEWTGTNYLYFTGVVGNYATVPDAAALDITGDLDLRARVAFDDWTPATATRVLSKFEASNLSYELLVTTGGGLQFNWSENGTTTKTATSTANMSLTDGTAKWIRATMDVNNGAAGNDVKFYTSDDGSTWSQLGSTVTTASTTSLYSGSGKLGMGATGAGGGNNVAMKFYRGQVYNGIGGTLVLDVDTSRITTGNLASFTAVTGQTVTVNRSATGRKTVAVVCPVWLFGTDDYMEVADASLLDFAATDSFTVIAVCRYWNTTASQAVIISKKPLFDTTAGYMIENISTAEVWFEIGDGSNRVINAKAQATLGSLSVLAAVRNVTSDTLAMYVNNAATPSADTSTGSLSNSDPLRIGRITGTFTEYADMELLGVAIFRRALSATELASLSTYYASRWS